MISSVRGYNGFLAVDKPSGMTSHDVVDRLRRILRQKRIGHTGTLDKHATGLLIVCLGRATKAARFVSDQDKVYRATIRLGQSSTTYDREGLDPSRVQPKPELSMAQIEPVLAHYTGIVQQKVPAYSAVSVDGRRLYQLARKGIQVETPTRTIEVKSITVHGYESPDLRIEVSCSKGTYMRSLANDIGERLGCGAYLEELRRTLIGSLSVERALTLEQIDELHGRAQLDSRLLTYNDVLHYGALRINQEFATLVVTGKDLKLADVVEVEGDFQAGDRVILKDPKDRVLAVGRAEIAAQEFDHNLEHGKLFSYLRVLN